MDRSLDERERQEPIEDEPRQRQNPDPLRTLADTPLITAEVAAKELPYITIWDPATREQSPAGRDMPERILERVPVGRPDPGSIPRKR